MNEIYKGMDNAAEQIDNNFKGIKDYVIEQGENYTKWASGKLEQWAHGSTVLENDGHADVAIELPIEFIGTPIAVGGIRSPSGAFARYTSHRTVAYDNSSEMRIGISVTGAGGEVEVSGYAVGRWKE